MMFVVDIAKFKKLLGVLEKYNPDVRVVCKNDRIHIYSLSPDMIAMVNAHLNDRYFVTFEGDEVEFNIDVGTLKKYISNLKGDLLFEYKDENIRLKNKNIEINTSGILLPNDPTNGFYKKDIPFGEKEFMMFIEYADKIIKMLKYIKKNGDFEIVTLANDSDSKNLYLQHSSDDVDMKLLVGLTTKDYESTEQKYPIYELLEFIKYISSFKDAHAYIYFDRDKPLKIFLNDSDDEHEVNLFIAPRVEV